MSEKIRYKAVIAEKTYTIISPETKSQLDLVTEMVNEQLNEIKQLSPDISSEEAAILCAINAVNDQVKKQTELLMLKKEMIEVKKANARVKELEKKVNKMNEVEEKARIALKEMGSHQGVSDPLQAQQILNQIQKQKIQDKSEG